MQSQKEREALLKRYKKKMVVNQDLNRQLVSAQDSHSLPIYRWFKYKESFSPALVRYLLDRYCPSFENILDPFAGTATTLFASRESSGYKGGLLKGLDVLPISQYVAYQRLRAELIDTQLIKDQIDKLSIKFPSTIRASSSYEYIAITEGAFPFDNKNLLDAYLTYCDDMDYADLRAIMKFAAFCVLEDCSYTSKDGSYLRWDGRSGHNQRSSQYRKKRISDFQIAVLQKLTEIVNDLDQPYMSFGGDIEIWTQSALKRLPIEPDDFYDCIITSPPYCNRYDYTRTYALELCFIGDREEDIKRLRQEMLSCTVESQPKAELQKMAGAFAIQDVFASSAAMMEVMDGLDYLMKMEELNNKSVPRMVKNYFLEMCYIINDIQRILRPGGYAIMVNDNVRYADEEIPVDLLLSYYAEQFGLEVESILVLPRGKGNSSQQMKKFGRTELRKCVYVWRKRS